MIRDTTKRQKLGWALSILYLCLLAYFMLSSESFGRTNTNRDYQYNLAPSKEISRYFRYYNTIDPLLFLVNMVGNVAVFLPFGFFLPIISRRSKKQYNAVVLGFGFSLMLETLRLTFHMGSFDADGVQLDTLGAALGYVVYHFVQYTRVKTGHRRLAK